MSPTGTAMNVNRGTALNNDNGCDSGREQDRLRSSLRSGSVATLSEKSGAPYPSRESSHSWMASTITVESVTS
jgi:hypothetical protein